VVPFGAKLEDVTTSFFARFFSDVDVPKSPRMIGISPASAKGEGGKGRPWQASERGTQIKDTLSLSL